MQKILLMMMLFSTFSTTTLATTYYVSPTGSDSANGSLSTPWKTITHGFQNANCGDTVLVENGTYVETVSVAKVCTFGFQFILQSQNKWGAIIAPTNAQLSANSGLVTQLTGDYTTIKNFEITGAGDGNNLCSGTTGSGPCSGVGVKVQPGLNGNQVIGNKVHDIGVNPGVCYAGAALNGAGIGTLWDSNFVYNVSPPRNTNFRCSQDHGVYLTGTTGGVGPTNNVVTNNVIADIWQGWCLQTEWNPQGNIFANNTCINAGYGYNFPTSSNYPNSGPTGGGLWLSEINFVGNNNVVNNNIFEHIPGLTCIFSNVSGTGNRLANNLVFDCPGYGSHPQIDVRFTATITGTVFADALFVNDTGTRTGDYHLQSTSPAINAGTSSNAPNHDFDGNTRPQGSGFDIGAYEDLMSGSPAAPTGLTATVQ